MGTNQMTIDSENWIRDKAAREFNELVMLITRDRPLLLGSIIKFLSSPRPDDRGLDLHSKERSIHIFNFSLVTTATFAQSFFFSFLLRFVR